MAASVEELIAAGMSPEAAQAVAHNLAANETVAVTGDQAPPHTPDPVEVLLLSLRLDLTQAHRDTVEAWLESQNVPPLPTSTSAPGVVTSAPVDPVAPVAPVQPAQPEVPTVDHTQPAQPVAEPVAPAPVDPAGSAAPVQQPPLT